MVRLLLLLALVFLAACETGVPAPPPGGARPVPDARAAAQAFVDVVAAVEPVAERECRARTSGVRCDFVIAVNSDLRAPPNAFQSVGRDGRPIITFTVAMISETGDADELAFILSHEASHHILGHIARQTENAAAGAAIFAGLAQVSGAGPDEIANAQEIGALVGARSFSKEFELEADQLGTIITIRSGFDPVRGAAYFARIRDPGDRFLGTHPPNTARLDVVHATARRMGWAG